MSFAEGYGRVFVRTFCCRRYQHILKVRASGGPDTRKWSLRKRAPNGRYDLLHSSLIYNNRRLRASGYSLAGREIACYVACTSMHACPCTCKRSPHVREAIYPYLLPIDFRQRVCGKASTKKCYFGRIVHPSVQQKRLVPRGRGCLLVLPNVAPLFLKMSHQKHYETHAETLIIVARTFSASQAPSSEGARSTTTTTASRFRSWFCRWCSRCAVSRDRSIFLIIHCLFLTVAL